MAQRRMHDVRSRTMQLSNDDALTSDLQPRSVKRARNNNCYCTRELNNIQAMAGRPWTHNNSGVEEHRLKKVAYINYERYVDD